MVVTATTAQPEPKPKAALELAADQSGTVKEASPASTGRYFMYLYFVFCMCNPFSVLKCGLCI